MYFSDYKVHSAPLFLNSGILPIKLLYFKSVASLLHDIANLSAPPNISDLFTCSSQFHAYSTRSAVVGNFHIKTSRTNQQLFSFSRTGANIWNGIPLKVRELEKASFKRKLKRMLLQILQTGEMNVDMRYLNLSKYAVS